MGTPPSEKFEVFMRVISVGPFAVRTDHHLGENLARAKCISTAITYISFTKLCKISGNRLSMGILWSPLSPVHGAKNSRFFPTRPDDTSKGAPTRPVTA